MTKQTPRQRRLFQQALLSKALESLPEAMSNLPVPKSRGTGLRWLRLHPDLGLTIKGRHFYFCEAREAIGRGVPLAEAAKIGRAAREIMQSQGNIAMPQTIVQRTTIENWTTYREAAKREGVKPETIAARARRGKWPKRANPNRKDGAIEILIPAAMERHREARQASMRPFMRSAEPVQSEPPQSWLHRLWAKITGTA